MSAIQVFDFEGRALTAYAFRGRECWLAKDVASALEYTPNAWKMAWSDWATEEDPELITTKDFLVLRGPELREFLGQFKGVQRDTLGSPKNLTIIYETGLNLVCTLSRKPLGKRLRRFVAEQVLPSLRRRSADADRLSEELTALNLRLYKSNNPTVWHLDIAKDLCALYRRPWDGNGTWPWWLRSPLAKIYRTTLGEQLYRELKKRNPAPRDGSNHYDWMTEARRELTERDMIRVSTVLRMSASPKQFFQRLDAEFGRTPKQLEMGA